MQPHHKAWLEAHPTRTARWLYDRLADGFHVHHIDHKWNNNHPSNLILVDGADHMMIHGNGRRYMPKFLRRSDLPGMGERALRLRQQGFPWRQVAIKCGLRDAGQASFVGRRHSERNDIPLPRFTGFRGAPEGPAPDPAMPEMLV